VCAHGELNQAISAIQSATVEGYDPIIVFSDFGEAILPAVKAAAAKGVTAVPWLVNIGGEPGKDYATFVGENYEELGKNTADFMAKEMHNKGNLIAIEGPPGNAYDEELNKYIKQRLAQVAPEIKWLATTFANWDPAESAQAASALLSKYPSVQGLITDEASTVPGIISRWQATGRPLPVIYSNDLNEVMSLYMKLKPKNPTLAYGFRSARTYGSRVALEAGMAAWEGKKVKSGEYLVESPSYNCTEVCEEMYDPNMPGSWVPTSKVPKEKLKPLLEGQ
jgi:ABC-type sugar transport system substrate-binding protein